MAKHDEISSTEKLLNLIRGETATGQERPESVSVPQSPKGRSFRLAKAWPLKKAITVGIDIGDKDLKLVKVRQSSDQRWKLLDFTRVPLESPLTKEGPEFPQFLRGALSDFCGPSEKCGLWTIMSSALVEMRDIRIPSRVPKKQIFNAVYWTLKKQFPFNEKESVFNFEVLGDVTEGGIDKTAVRVYTAPRQEIAQLRNFFNKSGFPLTGISIAPFAIQNLWRACWIEGDQGTVASLYVGRVRSRIDIFSSGNVVFTRGIKTGINSLIENILDGIAEGQNEKSKRLTEEAGSFSLTMDGQEMPVVLEEAEKTLFSLSPDFPSLTEADPGFYLKEEEIFNMILPALERLVRQIERSFEYSSVTLGNERVSKLYLGGEINYFERLASYIRDQVGVPLDVIDPLVPSAPVLGELIAPSSISERAAYVPAVGLALSGNPHTPNFIFTYKDKENAERVSRVNRGMLVGFVCMVAICMGIFWWQGGIEAAKKSQITTLRLKLAEYSPRTDQNHILLLAAKAKKKKDILREYSKRYEGMTLIGELSRRTPSHIRLLDITANLAKVTKSPHTQATKSLSLEGLVFGDRQALEASLAAYMVRLAACPLFRQPSIDKRSIESREGKEVLHFIAHLKVV